MAYYKKYVDCEPYKQVICNNPIGMLHAGIRNVIDETETQYLIQFKSGAAHWYSKDRFMEYKPKPVRKSRPKPKTEPQTKQLF